MSASETGFGLITGSGLHEFGSGDEVSVPTAESMAFFSLVLKLSACSLLGSPDFAPGAGFVEAAEGASADELSSPAQLASVSTRRIDRCAYGSDPILMN